MVARDVLHSHRSRLDQAFPTIADDIGRLPAAKLVIDGEVVSPDDDGRPNFGALQDDLKQPRYDRMVYYAFDLLHLDGFDTRPAALIERKRAILEVFAVDHAGQWGFGETRLQNPLP